MACAACHGERGEGLTKAEFYPRLAGKPAGYLFNQLGAFREGKRRSAIRNQRVLRKTEAALSPARPSGSAARFTRAGAGDEGLRRWAREADSSAARTLRISLRQKKLLDTFLNRRLGIAPLFVTDDERGHVVNRAAS